jgi:hypothetical protein
MKDNHEIVYRSLLEKLAGIDLAEAVTGLGGYQHGNLLWMKLLGRPYTISQQDIVDKDAKKPSVSIRIILCHYLLQAGQGENTGEWVSYRDFKDSAFFISNFQINAEDRIARYFSGKARELENAAVKLEGESYKDFQTGDVCYTIQALPRIPLLLVFYDKDEDFPSSCKLLFDRSAPVWLDMECLAVLGWIVAELLIRNDKSSLKNS